MICLRYPRIGTWFSSHSCWNNRVKRFSGPQDCYLQGIFLLGVSAEDANHRATDGFSCDGLAVRSGGLPAKSCFINNTNTSKYQNRQPCICYHIVLLNLKTASNLEPCKFLPELLWTSSQAIPGFGSMSGSVSKPDKKLPEERSKMLILGVSGSPRRGGNSDMVLDAILTGAYERGADTEILYLSSMEMSSCVGCERCRKDKVCTRFEDDLTPFFPKISRAEGIVLVTPVYNYNVTAWMKAFIDRLYCFYDFDNEHPRGWSSRLAEQGKAATLAIVAEQVDPKDLGVTLKAMRMPMEALGYRIVGELSVPGVFEAGVVGDRPEVLDQAARLGRDLAALSM